MVYLMMTEQKLKRRIQIIVAGCLTLFFVLVVVVVFQFTARINLDNEERAIRRQAEAIMRQIEIANMETEYFNSEQFRRDYVLRYNNHGRPRV